MKVYELEIEFEESKEILKFPPKYAYFASSYICTRIFSLKDFEYENIKVYTKKKKYVPKNNWIEDELQCYKMCCSSEEITIESNASDHHLIVVQIILEVNDRPVGDYIK